MHPLIESRKLNSVGQSKLFALKHQFSSFLDQLECLLPEGREKSIVFTKIQEASFFATRAICELDRCVEVLK